MVYSELLYIDFEYQPVVQPAQMGFLSVDELQPIACIRQNPYPMVRIRISWGWGVGCPGKPQGYPCQSLVLMNPWYRERLA